MSELDKLIEEVSNKYNHKQRSNNDDVISIMDDIVSNSKTVKQRIRKPNYRDSSTTQILSKTQKDTLKEHRDRDRQDRDRQDRDRDRQDRDRDRVRDRVRQDRDRHRDRDRVRQDRVRQDRVRQDRVRQDRVRQDRVRHREDRHREDRDREDRHREDRDREDRDREDRHREDRHREDRQDRYQGKQDKYDSLSSSEQYDYSYKNNNKLTKENIELLNKRSSESSENNIKSTLSSVSSHDNNKITKEYDMRDTKNNESSLHESCPPKDNDYSSIKNYISKNKRKNTKTYKLTIRGSIREILDSLEKTINDTFDPKSEDLYEIEIERKKHRDDILIQTYLNTKDTKRVDIARECYKLISDNMKKKLPKISI